MTNSSSTTEVEHEKWVVDQFPIGTYVMTNRNGAGRVKEYSTQFVSERKRPLTTLRISHEGTRESWAAPFECRKQIGRERQISHCMHGISLKEPCEKCES